MSIIADSLKSYRHLYVPTNLTVVSVEQMGVAYMAGVPATGGVRVAESLALEAEANAMNLPETNRKSERGASLPPRTSSASGDKHLCTDSLTQRQTCWTRCIVQRAGSWPTPASRLTTAMPADVGMNCQQTKTRSMASVVCPHEQHSKLSRSLGGNRDVARDFRMQSSEVSKDAGRKE